MSCGPSFGPRCAPTGWPRSGRAYGLDQNALAERLGVSQSRISRIERGELDRAEIAAVRGYVEALGGEVEIVAKFGDESITLG